ncbi:MAG: D-arabinose 5-phosphate isomerase [Sphingobacteriia bacterium 24-36-13]|jgi:arabinose-5-phosphate isomerase|uniref:KpsF/GutQ family sugar-phosphate isomerase n=1 Tax=Sediminibacterium sp. TaxID=1917865 RepID=UPI000BCF0468|nr:KpsF/GutQ family sugar-phosphate isomerase [Sediminibacterium sp.]OYY10958.1 MAG: D-arabinose 5-phosphate isomerase [Sphingobacteriia bacterium 35-36-14]OYZ53700.1 MAG: D-arabinose 5-phosphate isomerase [Sphingobacteriia bacterium 24-36-13]OZA64809.1 MAG: D-arabinose 5-phosphate isomerase [Sphingobacteriia bacterium 39-36-14]HQS24837.1 KpsF/GutQ family sugar-phosphate isomerase [Sediminibacterium sp.]HQS35442.1 KpsF/GutQ family sugar-phosphate isomerase [Sediminibacterium sp.]
MNNNIQALAQLTIETEAAAVIGLKAFINNDFEKIIQAIHEAKGRLIVSGIGKSAIVAQKIVATLNSTGTPSLFMHAADAIHGDLGMITSDDIVMLISKSGESPEIKVLIPLINNFGNLLIGMVGNTESFLAKQANLVLNTTVEKEACPNNLAPTSSTTAQMVMGDVLAVCLMKLNQFNNKDFAKFHPGGNLGKRLYLRVADLAAANEQPRVLPSATLKQVIVEITKNRMGVTAVVDENQQLIGIITDGDLRRMLEKTSDISTICASDILSTNPITVQPEALAVEALELLKKHDISQLIVAENGIYKGIIHIHDLIREGIV